MVKLSQKCTVLSILFSTNIKFPWLGIFVIKQTEAVRSRGFILVAPSFLVEHLNLLLSFLRLG